jgi:hypothetical protein
MGLKKFDCEELLERMKPHMFNLDCHSHKFCTLNYKAIFNVNIINFLFLNYPCYNRLQ